jgi:hypothetical protein
VLKDDGISQYDSAILGEKPVPGQGAEVATVVKSLKRENNPKTSGISVSSAAKVPKTELGWNSACSTAIGGKRLRIHILGHRGTRPCNNLI